MTEKKYLRWYNKAGYGAGDIAGNVVYALLSSFVMIFLTNMVGLSSGIVGTLIAVSKLFDGVTDVRNFGAIARSAECAGAHGLITPLKNSAPVNAEAIRSSAGALTAIPVCRVGSVRNTLKQLQSEGFQVVAATEKSRKLLYDADFRKPTVIVMGAEDTGISKEVLKLCDEQLAIPLIGHIESLNVSAAAAVMLFEAVRQRIGD